MPAAIAFRDSEREAQDTHLEIYMTQYKLDKHGRVVEISPYLRILFAILVFSVALGGLAWWFQDDLKSLGLPLFKQTADNGIPELPWELLQTLDYKNGQAPPELKAFVGQQVKIPGFIVPLDAVEDRLTEFLLVPVYGLCIHVPPPPPNLMVHVKDTEGFKGKMWMAEGIWLSGIFQIQAVDSEYGSAGFRINVLSKPRRNHARISLDYRLVRRLQRKRAR